MKIGLLVLMVIFLAVLISLFVLSYKVLYRTRQQEKAESMQKEPKRQLHPKLEKKQ